MRRTIVAFGALTAIACGSPSAANRGLDLARLPATVTLGLGESATVGGTVVTFARVQDSRCPIDVVCIAAGNADVRLAVRSADDDPPVELTLVTPSGPAPSSATAFGLTFTLLEVDPAPRSTDTHRAYRIHLGVSRAR